MQKRFGFAPLGPADGPVKRDILGYNAARHYRLDLAADLDRDGIGRIKAAYLARWPGTQQSRLRLRRATRLNGRREAFTCGWNLGEPW